MRLRGQAPIFPTGKDFKRARRILVAIDLPSFCLICGSFCGFHPEICQGHQGPLVSAHTSIYPHPQLPPFDFGATLARVSLKTQCAKRILNQLCGPRQTRWPSVTRSRATGAQIYAGHVFLPKLHDWLAALHNTQHISAHQHLGTAS